MLHLQRLNLDSSWYLQWNGLRLIIDPWLTGPEVDGFSWLNKQWHIREPIAPEALPGYDAVLITQSYEDHCHLETLRRMDSRVPYLCTAKAWKRLRRQLPGRNYILLEDETAVTHFGLIFHALRPDKIIDPVYYALVISDAAGAGIFYCPHGFFLRPFQTEALQAYHIHLLMTTFTDFRLPGIMGGHVNPGMENVNLLCRQLKARYLVNTHDERKKGQGLVFTLGKVTYTDQPVLENGIPTRILSAPDYEVLSVNL